MAFSPSPTGRISLRARWTAMSSAKPVSSTRVRSAFRITQTK